MKTVIIAGFPGVGKSTAFREAAEQGSTLTIKDSDSSQFAKDESWPNNYVADIEANVGKYSVIMVSTHDEVRAALHAKGLSFVTVYPAKYLLGAYQDRYDDRGSPEAFVEVISANWDSWIEGIRSHKYGKSFCCLMHADDYLDLDLTQQIYDNFSR